MSCKIVFSDGKWQCIDETGKKWCSFSPDHKSWAEEVAKANGFKIVQTSS